MTKKVSGTRDHRQEPGAPGTGDDFRVDRVYAPPAAKRGTDHVPAVGRQPTNRTIPPQSTSGSESADTELSLRRQLSRLQRQHAEAQRELANKDDELASEVEKRVDVAAQLEQLQAAMREHEQRVVELGDYRARTEGIEQRLQEAIASADELTHLLQRERAERGSMAVQFDETTASYERARQLWKEENLLAEEHHAADLAQFEAQRNATIVAAEVAKNAAAERQREAHAAEIAELEAAHARSLATLRGALEPKVAEARDLAELIERLNSEMAALRSEQMRDLAERSELHKWELTQQAEAHAAELATQARSHTNELGRATEELEAKQQTVVQVERNAMLREQLWEQTVAALRDSQKKLQQELAEAKERAAQADADKSSIEQRLIATLQNLEKLHDDQRELHNLLEASEGEARRNAMDRQRFAAYLEEGLALLGAIPPTEPAPIEPDEIDDAPPDDQKSS